jgi:Peptidase family M1 domain
MLVNEILLARMADPDDDVVAMICAHEVAHLWFGCHVSMRWWDDLWQADALPGRQPVSSPVESAADALFRLPALTYSKGAAVIRQLAALIGDDAMRAGLAEFIRRFGGSAGLDDLIGCWSRSSGRDLGGWAQEWLRTEGASTLRAVVAAGPDGTIGSLAVEQDEPRTHRLGIGLYDRSGPSGSGLRRRRVISAEISGARCEVPVPAGEPAPDALVLNDGDLSYAEISFDGDPGGAGRSGDGRGRPGQEALLAPSLLMEYRERYFADALPALDGREVHVMRALARALYPAMLAGPATLTATAAALERGGLSHGLRLVLLEQEAVLRAVLAARSVPRRWA